MKSYEFKECGIIYRISSALKAHQRILIDLKHELKSGKAFIGNGELIQHNIRKCIIFRSLLHVRKVHNPLYGNVTELIIPRLTEKNVERTLICPRIGQHQSIHIFLMSRISLPMRM